MTIYATLERGNVSYDVMAVVDVRAVAAELDVPAEYASAYRGQYFVDVDRVCVDEPGYPMLTPNNDELQYIQQLALKQLS